MPFRVFEILTIDNVYVTDFHSKLKLESQYNIGHQGGTGKPIYLFIHYSFIFYLSKEER